jgi:hypothetical protein
MEKVKNPGILSRRTIYSLLAGILILALVLRIWGLGFGLPYEYHVDEDQYVRQAASMGSAGLKPAEWFNPPLFKYLLLVEYGAYFLVGKVLGWFASSADFGARLSLDPSVLYLLARGTSAVMGSLTVLVVAWIGMKAYQWKVGLFSAALMSVAFLPVRESHFAVNDAAAVFMVSLVLLAAVGILKSGGWRWYLLGGIALGLGFATKYHTVAAIVPLLLAHFFSPGISLRKPGLRKLLVAFVIAVTSAVLASPFFLVGIWDVWVAMSRLSSAGQAGYLWQIDPSGGYIFYLKTLFWGLGWPLAALCIIIAIAGVVRHRPVDLVLLCFPWLIFLYLGLQKMFFGRFMLPVVAPLVLVSASFIVEVVEKFVDKSSWRTAALVGAWLILAVQPLLSSIRFDNLLTRQDTRTIAKAWIEQNIPAGAGVAMDWLFHCPPLSTADRPRVDSTKIYRVWMPEFGVGTGLSDNSIDWYHQNGYQYLVVCSSISRLMLGDEMKDHQRQAFYDALDRDQNLIYSIAPSSQGSEVPFIFDEIYGPAISLWQRERPGPAIKIYRLAGDNTP